MSDLIGKPLEDYTLRDWIDSYRRDGELPPGVDGRLDEARDEDAFVRRIVQPSDPTIDLWTFQSPGFLEELQQQGVIHGCPLKEISEPSFIAPYLWMMGQMHKRLPDCRGHSPVWAYTHKPDLRFARWAWYTGGSWMLRMHLRVPVQAVLVSEYDGWHSVLNDHPHLTKSEDRTWDEDVQKRVDSGEIEHVREARRIIGVERRAEVWSSWERIFDVEYWTKDPEWFGQPWFQTCIDGLQVEWVVDVETYKTGTTKKDREDRRKRA